MVFEQTLSGLIKALRANKRDEQRVIDNALAEIRDEVRSKDWDVKAAAVLKLTYLEMLGHPTLIQHSFPVIECMASPKFHIKQIGYLAASQSFGESTEVILLTNNLIKKDLTGSSSSLAGPSSSGLAVLLLALTSLPALLVASPQLASDLLPELLKILTHSRPHVRRIATLVIGKIWASQHSLPLEFGHVEKLRSGLNDDDASVVSATVNVMLELARTREESLQSLLTLAPELFDLLTNSTNNWMLIKVVKLFAILTPVEPRLVRKLLPPLSNLISTTPAFSLLYECIQTVLVGGMLSSPTSSDSTSLASVCIEKLSAFLSDADQNLRYIALKGLSALLGTPHAGLLAGHYDEILACIDEDDLTIRLKALELVEKLTDRRSCKEVVGRLLFQVAPSAAPGADRRQTTEPGVSANRGARRSAAASLRAVASNYDASSPSGVATDPDTPTGAASPTSTQALAGYRHRLLLLILRLTSRASDDGSQLYVNITNFEWYIDTLVTVAYLSLAFSASGSGPPSTSGGSIGQKVAEALLDVTARAPAVRENAIKRMKRLLADYEGFADRKQGNGRNAEPVVQAAAFVMSEYGGAGEVEETVELVLHRMQSGTSSGPLLLATMKLLARWTLAQSERWEENRLARIQSYLSDTAARLEGLSAEAQQHAQLLRLLLSGLDGPRLAAEPTQPSEGPRLVAEPEEKEQPSLQEDDPEHNPFAGPSSRALPPASTNAQEGEKVQEQQRGAPASLTLLDRLFFAYELRALAQGAQDLVAPPDELDLDAWVGPDLSDPALLEDSEDDKSTSRGPKPEVDEYGRPKVLKPSVAEEKQRLAAAENGQKPLKKSKKGKRREGAPGEEEQDDVDSIPIVKLDLDGIESDPASPIQSGKAKAKKSQKSSGSVPIIARTRPRSPSPPPLILSAGGEAPVSRSKATSPVPPSPAFGSDQKAKSNGKGRATGEDAPGVEDATTAAAATAPVKVVKVKKKSKSKDDGGVDGTAAGAADEAPVTAVRKKKKKVKPDQGQEQDVAI